MTDVWEITPDRTFKGPFFLRTDGSGSWSKKAQTVVIDEIAIVNYPKDDEDYPGQPKYVMAFFDKKIWDTKTNGLIYTDKQFEKDMNDLLTDLILPISVGWSEQGMQSNNAAHFDAWTKK